MVLSKLHSTLTFSKSDILNAFLTSNIFNFQLIYQDVILLQMEEHLYICKPRQQEISSCGEI